LHRALNRIVNANDAICYRKLGMQAQMNKGGGRFGHSKGFGS
jgi:hypothetical protein